MVVSTGVVVVVTTAAVVVSVGTAVVVVTVSFCATATAKRTAKNFISFSEFENLSLY